MKPAPPPGAFQTHTWKPQHADTHTHTHTHNCRNTVRCLVGCWCVSCVRLCVSISVSLTDLLPTASSSRIRSLLPPPLPSSSSSSSSPPPSSSFSSLLSRLRAHCISVFITNKKNHKEFLRAKTVKEVNQCVKGDQEVFA